MFVFVNDMWKEIPKYRKYFVQNGLSVGRKRPCSACACIECDLCTFFPAKQKCHIKRQTGMHGDGNSTVFFPRKVKRTAGEDKSTRLSVG